jgi:hypothetical protein
MAPSFTLFNQSFDSFANDGHLSLNADSFGFGRTESSAAMEGILRHTASSSGMPPVGHLGGGGSTSFAYSPVHSFDAAIHNSNHGVLHGQPHLHHHHAAMAAAAAPMLLPPPPTTQVLYRRPFSPMMPPTFYSFLGKFKEAFKGCTFLLPGLKTIVIDTKTTTTPSVVTTAAIDSSSSAAAKTGDNENDEETPDVATVSFSRCPCKCRVWLAMHFIRKQFLTAKHTRRDLLLYPNSRNLRRWA